jgi:hypothetical protein
MRWLLLVLTLFPPMSLAAETHGEPISTDPKPEGEPVEAEPGTLRVISQPAGATVRVDGRELGPAPVELMALEAGPHLVEVSLPPYATVLEAVEVPSGRAVQVEHRLAHVGGELLLMAKSEETTISIEGVAMGAAPLHWENLRPGAWTVRFERQGHVPVERTAQVRATELTRVRVKLEAIKEPKGKKARGGG